MSKEQLKDLTKEQKESILNEVNSEQEEKSEEGNTSIFTMQDIDEKSGEGTAQAQYERSISANAQSLYALDKLLNMKDGLGGYKISRKNLIKLVFATLRLPEEGAVLKFGGGGSQQQACEFAYAQMQLAANTRAFILGVDAMRQQRRAMKEAEAEKEENSSEG